MNENNDQTETTRSFLQELLTQAPESLPILRQSFLKVLDLTADQRSNASDVGEVIMRDQALMANVIKVANSPAYHTRSPVKSPTHAVALLGFDVMRSMAVAAQLVEQAEDYGANKECLKRLLARSLVAANTALELGKATQYQDMGVLFTNTMLYTLGDLVLAFCRPDLSEKLEFERATSPNGVAKLELELLGQPLSRFGAAIAKHWHLPASLIDLLEKRPILTGQRLDTQQKQLEGLVHSANELSRCLLNPPSESREETFQDLKTLIPPSFGLKYETLVEVVIKAFANASQFSDIVKIDQSYFLPMTTESGVNTHLMSGHITQKILRAIQPTSEDHSRSIVDSQVSAPSVVIPGKKKPEARVIPVDFIQPFTIKALEIREPNALLTSAAEGLHFSCGFQRVVLSLIVPDDGMLKARVGYGPNVQTLLPLFNCSLKDNNFFIHALQGYNPIKIASLNPEVEAGRLPKEFLQKWGDHPCFVGPLFTPIKPIGLIIADQGTGNHNLTDGDYDTFVIVLSQVNTNLARLAR